MFNYIIITNGRLASIEALYYMLDLVEVVH